MKRVTLYWHLNKRITDNHVLSEVFVDLNKLEMNELKSLKGKLEQHPGGVLLKIDKTLCLQHVKNLIAIREQYPTKPGNTEQTE